MLAYILAIGVGLGSITLYLAAFFFPEVHRKHDFFWSGVGCFYALVLWVDAGNLSATELSGHAASIALMFWLGWQTLSLRRKRTPRDLQTPLTDQSWKTFSQEITALGTTWLKRTPLGRFLPEPAARQTNTPINSGTFRVSSLKQVDYEFVDDLPPAQTGPNPTQYGPDRKAVSPIKVQDVADSPVLGSPQLQGGAPMGWQPPREISTQPNSNQIEKPRTLLEKGIVLKDWLVEVVAATTRPKPKKPVIVIPLREPKATSPSAEQVHSSVLDPNVFEDRSVKESSEISSLDNPQSDSVIDGQYFNGNTSRTDSDGQHPQDQPFVTEDSVTSDETDQDQDEIDNWSEFEAEAKPQIENNPEQSGSSASSSEDEDIDP
jgi:hypothetical protein